LVAAFPANSAQAATTITESTAGPSKYGLIPTNAVSASVNDAAKSGGLSILANLPTSYDLRNLTGVVQPVGDQGSYGTCWAWAATGSAETSLKRNGRIPTQLSALHLVNAVYGPGADATYSDIYNRGGNSVRSALAWSRWRGPTSEAAYPYSLAPQLLSESQINSNTYRLSKAIVFPSPRASGRVYSPENVNAIKTGIMNYGGLAMSVRAADWSGNIYNPNTVAVYHPTYLGSDHVITIIGWNDNYSASNFATRPPGNGAFLAQNSWGSSWGNGGYLWLSYYDATAGESWYFDLTYTSGYGHVYYYDQGPFGTGQSGKTMYNANIFSVPRSEKPQSLKAVSFYAGEPNTAYQVSAYKNPSATNPMSGTQLDIGAGSATVTTGSFTNAGLYQVDLGAAATIQPGEDFSVVVSTSTASGASTIVWYGKSTTAAKRSFYGTVSGSTVSWTALNGAATTLKAITRDVVNLPTTHSISGTQLIGYSLQANYSVWTPSTTKVSYQWLRAGVAISGATSQTYKLVADDVGKKISVQLTGTATGYDPASVTLTAVGPIKAGSMMSPARYYVSGTPRTGATLTAYSSAWYPSGPSISYQWLRNGLNIPGANSQLYTPTSSDVGKYLSVKMTGTVPGYNSLTVTTAQVGPVTSSNVVPPSGIKIVGTLKAGYKLSLSMGAWTPSSTRLSYQWKRGGSTGLSLGIPGASSSTYVLTSADVGKYISVVITGYADGYVTATVTPAQVGPVG
jgi:C1A family cysteine protease